MMMMMMQRIREQGQQIQNLRVENMNLQTTIQQNEERHHQYVSKLNEELKRSKGWIFFLRAYINMLRGVYTFVIRDNHVLQPIIPGTTEHANLNSDGPKTQAQLDHETRMRQYIGQMVPQNPRLLLTSPNAPFEAPTVPKITQQSVDLASKDVENSNTTRVSVKENVPNKIEPVAVPDAATEMPPAKRVKRDRSAMTWMKSNANDGLRKAQGNLPNPMEEFLHQQTEVETVRIASPPAATKSSEETACSPSSTAMGHVSEPPSSKPIVSPPAAAARRAANVKKRKERADTGRSVAASATKPSRTQATTTLPTRVSLPAAESHTTSSFVPDGSAAHGDMEWMLKQYKRHEAQQDAQTKKGEAKDSTFDIADISREDKNPKPMSNVGNIEKEDFEDDVKWFMEEWDRQSACTKEDTEDQIEDAAKGGNALDVVQPSVGSNDLPMLNVEIGNLDDGLDDLFD